MIDDLVKRLRNGLCMLAQEEAADRIEELEAKLAKAVEALEWFYRRQHTSGESPRDCLQNGIYKALTTLAELTGESE